MTRKIDKDYEKINAIGRALFGASPINLHATVARRLAEKLAAKVLAEYRAECRRRLGLV